MLGSIVSRLASPTVGCTFCREKICMKLFEGVNFFFDQNLKKYSKWKETSTNVKITELPRNHIFLGRGVSCPQTDNQTDIQTYYSVKDNRIFTSFRKKINPLRQRKKCKTRLDKLCIFLDGIN